MKVSLVIPNWNGAERLKKNLPKILLLGEVYEVIVVDDGSSDNSVEVIKKFPDVKLVTLNKNYGFSTAVNKGVERAQGEIVFLLNTDAVPEKNCIKSALDHFKDENVFSVSCNTGGSWSWVKFDQGYLWHYMVEKVSPVHQTLYASGGSAFFRRDLWQKLGGLDADFNPFYEEDVDLGYRATKRGYMNLWVKDCMVEHAKFSGVIREHFSGNYINNIAQRNQLLVIWKNIHDKRLFTQHILALVKRLLLHPKYWLVFITAVQKLPSVRRKRMREKEQAQLTDLEILSKFS